MPCAARARFGGRRRDARPGGPLHRRGVPRYPLVAFSEPRHGAGGTKEFFAALIREPGFAGTVQDLVIECGNVRYQDVVDRYVAGSRSRAIS